MSYLTIFTAPKPFSDPHVARLQRNAIRSWLALGPEVEVLMIGDEAGMAVAATELGVVHLRDVDRHENGTPLVRSIFDLARKHSQSPYFAYVNADILLFADLLEATRQSANGSRPFLIIGQPLDLEGEEALHIPPPLQDPN